MASTSAVYARVDTDLKQSAEAILAQLGISPSSAIQMLYSQVVLRRGLPFEARLPQRPPVSMRPLTREELDAELERGMESIRRGDVLSGEDVDAILAAELGI